MFNPYSTECIKALQFKTKRKSEPTFGFAYIIPTSYLIRGRQKQKHDSEWVFTSGFSDHVTDAIFLFFLKKEYLCQKKWGKKEKMRGMNSRYYNAVPPKALHYMKLILMKCLSMSVYVSLSGVICFLHTRWEQIKQHQNSNRTLHSRTT